MIKEKLFSVFKIIIKISISVFLLYYLINKADFNNIRLTVFSISVYSFLFICFLFFIGVFLNAWKWYVLLPNQTILKLFRLSVVSYFYSFILPGQIFGEFSKVLILRKEHTETEVVAASVLIDKIISIIGLLIIGVAGLCFADFKFKQVFFVYMLILLVCCIVFFLLVRLPLTYKIIERIINSINFKSPVLNDYKLKSLFFLNSIYTYSKGYKALILNIVIGIFSQFIGIFSYWFIGQQLSFTVSILDWCWIQALLSVALLLPLTMGGIGLREATLVVILGWLMVPHEKALSLALILSVATLILSITGGIMEFYRIWIVKKNEMVKL